MTVVADASPLNYVILIGHADVLPPLYQRIFIPPAVMGELRHPGTPVTVRHWVAHAPDWLQVHPVRPHSDAAVEALDPGERDAIFLALELKAKLLIDEASGRRIAIARGIPVTGTLSVLEQAARRSLLDFRVALARLDATNFRLTPKLRAAFLARFPNEP